MIFNSIEEYDMAEKAAIARLPNRITECCRAVAFDAVGYPTRVGSLAELWRYADIMQEFMLRKMFDAIGGLTAHEFELVEEVTERVWNLTGNMCEKQLIPGASLISAVPVYRAINYIFPNGCRVFEMGAGSGYVGALLLCEGRHQYMTTDVSQAFSLWQMKLLDEFGRDYRFIPWWEWMTLIDPPQVEVVTANHMLNEMHLHALSYLCRMAKRMIVPGGYFMAENFGSEVIRKNAETQKMFEKTKLTAFAVRSGKSVVQPTVTWSDMLQFWQSYGGVPMSADEKFMGFLKDETFPLSSWESPSRSA